MAQKAREGLKLLLDLALLLRSLRMGAHAPLAQDWWKLQQVLTEDAPAGSAFALPGAGSLVLLLLPLVFPTGLQR